MTMPTEQASQRRRSKWYDRPPSTLEGREFAFRAVYHHFPDQEVLDGLHEELRQHREHFVWLESEGHWCPNVNRIDSIGYRALARMFARECPERGLEG
jgi:hypothetical protein